MTDSTVRTFEQICDSIWDVIISEDATAVANELIAARDAFQAENIEGRFNPGSILQENGVTADFHAAVMHEYNRIVREQQEENA